MRTVRFQDVLSMHCTVQSAICEALRLQILMMLHCESSSYTDRYLLLM